MLELDPAIEQADGPAARCASNGTPYATVVSDGVKPEGEGFPMQCEIDPDAPDMAPALAWTTYNRALREFIGAGKKIEWRRRPALETYGHWCSVYSRVAVVG